MQNAVFHHLTVLQQKGRNTHGNSMWLCSCKCGNKTTVIGSHLKSGHTRSCGCLGVETRRKKYDLTNQLFGRLTAIKRIFENAEFRGWLCRCVCGKETTVAPDNLKNGHTQSCGCLAIERRIEAVSAAKTTHGHCKGGRDTRTRISWRSMIERCCNPNHTSYSDYGGRGITVCERWKTSFENFLQDMGERPPEKTLDRENVNGSYEPLNCRWATNQEQARNRRTSNMFQFSDGEILTEARKRGLL